MCEWIALHRDELAAQFSTVFGLQVHEWYDFVEAAYAKAHT
nr:hypothetical protein [Pseudomonas sp. GLE121]